MGFPYPYPLGLPKGSVRSTVTLILSVNLMVLTYFESSIAVNLSTMVVVTLTFYFGGRMRGVVAPVPRDVKSTGLRAWGLPAGTIRTLLFFMYIAMFIFFVIDARTAPPYFFQILNIMLGYILGSSANRISNFVRKRRGKVEVADDVIRSITIWGHLRALVMLSFTILTFLFTIFYTNYLFDVFGGILPLEDEVRALQVWILANSVAIGFYFGERK
jgi:hypothetical protein